MTKKCRYLIEVEGKPDKCMIDKYRHRNGSPGECSEIKRCEYKIKIKQEYNSYKNGMR